MKKTVIFIALALLACTAFAKGGLKLKSGTSDFLKESVKAAVTLDFSSAQWEEKESFVKWSGNDFETRSSMSLNGFIEGFNAKTPGLQVSGSADDAKYIIEIKLSNLEWHQSGGMWGQFYVRCWGEITVKEAAGGSVVATIEIDGVSGPGDFVPNDRFTRCFDFLGRALSKLK